MWLLKDCVDDLAPFLCYMFNTSLQQGIVPSTFKSAFITPLLKKPDLDSADVKSYRPISNLPVLSKLLERLVARQLLDYLNAQHLLPDCQSAYRAHYSTETAILKVMSDILLALDSGDLTLLTLLDLSAAFDTVDHVILLQRLKTSYGITPSFAVYHKVRSSDRSCFCSTLQTLLDWRLRTVSMFISTRTTRRCMAPAIQTV